MSPRPSPVLPVSPALDPSPSHLRTIVMVNPKVTMGPHNSSFTGACFCVRCMESHQQQNNRYLHSREGQDMLVYYTRLYHYSSAPSSARSSLSPPIIEDSHKEEKEGEES